jgi:hypothetical protein
MFCICSVYVLYTLCIRSVYVLYKFCTFMFYEKFIFWFPKIRDCGLHAPRMRMEKLMFRGLLRNPPPPDNWITVPLWHCLYVVISDNHVLWKVRFPFAQSRDCELHVRRKQHSFTPLQAIFGGPDLARVLARAWLLVMYDIISHCLMLYHIASYHNILSHHHSTSYHIIV